MKFDSTFFGTLFGGITVGIILMGIAGYLGIAGDLALLKDIKITADRAEKANIELTKEVEKQRYQLKTTNNAITTVHPQMKAILSALTKVSKEDIKNAEIKARDSDPKKFVEWAINVEPQDSTIAAALVAVNMPKDAKGRLNFVKYSCSGCHSKDNMLKSKAPHIASMSSTVMLSKLKGFRDTESLATMNPLVQGFSDEELESITNSFLSMQ